MSGEYGHAQVLLDYQQAPRASHVREPHGRGSASIPREASAKAEGVAESPEGDDNPIRVLVVDDNDLFRSGLAALLARTPDIEVVGQASGGEAAVSMAADLRPDVVLMDLRMPDLNGSSATRVIVERDPRVRVVVLSVVAEGEAVAAAVKCGAIGYVAKDASVDAVVMAVRAAAQGASFFSPVVAEVLFEYVRSQVASQGPPLDDGLSSREREVLRLIARGLRNDEIAEALSISPRTAKNHVSNILAKLGFASRAQAATYAVRHGEA